MAIERKISWLVIVAVLICLIVPTNLRAEDSYSVAETETSLLDILEHRTEGISGNVGTLNIKMKDDKGAYFGSVFTAVRLLNVNYTPEQVTVEVNNSLKDFWSILLGDNSNIAGISEALKNKTITASTITEDFDNYYRNLSNEDKAELDHITSTNVDGGGAASFNSTPLGLYVIVQTGAPDDGFIASAPMLVCLPTKIDNSWNNVLTACPKNSAVALDLTIQDDDANKSWVEEIDSGFNAVESYKAVAQLPVYGENVKSNVTYKINNSFSSGVTYNNDVKVYYLPKGYSVENASDSDWIEADPSTYNIYDDNGGFTVDLSQSGNYLNNINGQFGYIKLLYTGTTNTDAVIRGTGNDVTATLDYTTGVDFANSQIVDGVKAYVFDLEIDKVDAEKNIPLSGAEFELYRGEVKPENKIYFVENQVDVDVTAFTSARAIKIADEVATDGAVSPGAVAIYQDLPPIDPNGISYRYTADFSRGEGTVSLLKIGADGKLNIDGLKEGEYNLVEITSPAGYNTPDTPFPYKIEGTRSDTISYEKNRNNVDGYYDLSNFDEPLMIVGNNSGILTPGAGGVGTVIMTMIGAMIMVGAGYVFLKKKKA